MVIAFIDENPVNRELLKEWLISYTIRKNLEFDVLWFSVKGADIPWKKYARGISFAFISIDDPAGIDKGRGLERHNPDCFVCYYRKDGDKLAPQHDICCAKGETCRLLAPFWQSRLVRFLLWEDGESPLDAAMDEMLAELAWSGRAYGHESKRNIQYFPIRNILYFQSDLKYVNIRQLQGGDGRLYAKLSDIEHNLAGQGMSWCFVRVHKSYIVNLYHIEAVDKQKHALRLSSGEELPISDAYYKPAIGHLKRFHAGVGRIEWEK